MLISTILVLLFTAAAVLVYRRRHAVTVLDRADALDEHQPTEKEIDQAFRETEAPERRQYRGGEYGNDQSGRSYVADVNGSLRRVAVVGTPEGGETIVVARKPDKATRKARKRERAREREAMRVSVEASIERTLMQIRTGLLARGADQCLVAQISPKVDSWHELGRRILAAAASAEKAA